MKLDAIIQARCGSTRMPNKVLRELAGRPLIWHVVDRLQASRKVGRTILATTTNPMDDALEDWAARENVLCFRGSEEDVLDRYFQCAKQFGSRAVVRVTADDPFKDPVLIDAVADLLETYGLDFACNNQPPTFPEGLDTEIFTFAALERAARDATDPFEREHMTQHFYRNPGLFKQRNLASHVDRSHLRWTIDVEADFQMTSAVFDELFVEGGRAFRTEQILELLGRRPEIAEMNTDVARSAMYSKADVLSTKPPFSA